MPYISASIIFQLLAMVIPQLEAVQKEGESGRKKIIAVDRATGPSCSRVIQGFLISVALENGQFGEGAVLDPGWGFRLMSVITLTSGTAFIMWLGEQITERGIGNGISLVIFAGIIVRIPSALGQLFELIRTDQFSLARPARPGCNDRPRDRRRGVLRARRSGGSRSSMRGASSADA